MAITDLIFKTYCYEEEYNVFFIQAFMIILASPNLSSLSSTTARALPTIIFLSTSLMTVLFKFSSAWLLWELL